MSSGFFSKFFKNDPIEKLWNYISSIKNLNEKKVVSFRNEIGVMCWEKEDQIKVFCENKLDVILNDDFDPNRVTCSVDNKEVDCDTWDEKDSKS